MIERAAWVAGLTLGVSTLFLPAAGAYIDPGAGSYVFQVAVGALLGAAVTVKLFWHRIAGAVRRLFSRSS